MIQKRTTAANSRPTREMRSPAKYIAYKYYSRNRRGKQEKRDSERSRENSIKILYLGH